MHEHFVTVTKKTNYAILWERTFPSQKPIVSSWLYLISYCEPQRSLNENRL